MKICLFGDLHCAKKMGSGLQRSVFKDTLEVYYSYKMNIIRKSIEWMQDIIKKQKVDMAICMGDVFHRFAKMDMFIFNLAMRMFDDLADKTELRIITGNHDILDEVDMNLNALTPFNYIAPVFHGKPKTEYIQAIDSVFFYVPYFADGDILVKIYKDLRKQAAKYPKGTKKILFAHHDIRQFFKWADESDIYVGDKSYEDFNLDFFDHIYLGHIHWRAMEKKAKTIGSIISRTFNDRNDLNRGITILDVSSEGLKEKFIPNPHSPLYVTIENKEDPVLKQVEEEKKKGRTICAEIRAAELLEQIPADLIDFVRPAPDLKQSFDKIIHDPDLGDEVTEITDWRSYLNYQLEKFMKDRKLKKREIKEYKKLFFKYLELAREEEYDFDEE